MTDCPTCHRPIDGLFCRDCSPKAPRNPPIDPEVKARIDAICRKAGWPVARDREAEAERVAIMGEW